MAGECVAVIGAGLAGAAAAAAARQAGAEVVLIHHRPGATSFCSGALDLAADSCPAPERPDRWERHLVVNLNHLLLHQPDHPYALLTADSATPADDLITLFHRSHELLFPPDGLFRMENNLDYLQPLFSCLGTLKFTSLFPLSSARPDAPGMSRPLVLGVRGLVDFDPEMWARTAAENAGRLGIRLEPIPGWLSLENGREWQSPALSAHIGHAADVFLSALKEAVALHPEATAVVLPAIIPSPGREDLIGRMGETVSRPVYEVLSLPPSVPGLRLAAHLLNQCRHMGIRVIAARVEGFTAQPGRIQKLHLAAGEKKEEVEAGAVVLASGKFLGRGLEKKRGFREKIFDLPVFLGERPVNEIFIEKVLGLHVTDPHPLFSAGLRVNPQLQPLDRDGRPAFQNLFAAGAILAGHNSVSAGTPGGVSLATGVRAGEAAAFGSG